MSGDPNGISYSTKVGTLAALSTVVIAEKVVLYSTYV
jgi:hypothetical protein